MKRYIGQTEVVGGYYFNTETWKFEVVSGDKGLLAGKDTDSYLKVPFVLVAPLVLAVSGLFVVFLPCIGFALLLDCVVRRCWKAIQR